MRRCWTGSNRTVTEQPAGDRKKKDKMGQEDAPQKTKQDAGNHRRRQKTGQDTGSDRTADGSEDEQLGAAGRSEPVTLIQDQALCSGLF